MDLSTIGKNIKKYRIEQNMKQETLAEKVYLTPHYLSMIENGHKVPALDTFIEIANALNVSADFLLCDVLKATPVVKNSALNEKLADLTPTERRKIYDIIDILAKK